jgi:hypothetical protein
MNSFNFSQTAKQIYFAVCRLYSHYTRVNLGLVEQYRVCEIIFVEAGKELDKFQVLKGIVLQLLRDI